MKMPEALLSLRDVMTLAGLVFTLLPVEMVKHNDDVQVVVRSILLATCRDDF